MTKIQIRSRWNSDTVLFECDAPEGLESGLHMRHALEKATQQGVRLDGASLDGASLDGARLDGASLVRARLDGASLVRASLDGARLDGASLVRARLDGARLDGARLDGASLDGASLDGASLGSIRMDFWDVLLRAPQEIAGVRAALVGGRVDGSTYSGECACLVGTIANVRDTDYHELGNNLNPDSSRPAEVWFMGIRKGDTPDTNQQSKLAVEWLDELVGLLALGKPS